MGCGGSKPQNDTKVNSIIDRSKKEIEDANRRIDQYELQIQDYEQQIEDLRYSNHKGRRTNFKLILRHFMSKAVNLL